MGPAAWRTAVATLVLMGAFAPSAASGLRHARGRAAQLAPRAHAAVAIMHCGNNGCTETSQLTVAANGGLGETMTDDIPANATEASVTIAPVCKAAGDRRTARAAPALTGRSHSYSTASSTSNLNSRASRRVSRRRD
jgi:hypothetical protein